MSSRHFLADDGAETVSGLWRLAGATAKFTANFAWRTLSMP
jgi:hypothetical protein